MARKKVDEKKPRRARQPRDRKVSQEVANVEDRTWAILSKNKMLAVAILNNERSRPYWASIPKNGPAPVAAYYPCSFFEARGRIYYGFLLRDHRNEFVDLTEDCLKVPTDLAVELYKGIRK